MNYDVLLTKGGHGTLAQGDVASAIGACVNRSFDTVVFCAEEFPFQSFRDIFPQTELVFCPLNDAELTSGEAMRATDAGQKVVSSFLRGRKVLVTCRQGRNRSGLVSALALRQILGISGAAAVERVRQKRTSSPHGPAMSNLSFNAYVKALGTARAAGVLPSMNG